MNKRKSYHHYTKRFFLTYAFVLIGLIAVSLLIYLFLNLKLFVIESSRATGIKMGEIIKEEYLQYYEEIEDLSENHYIVEALVDRQANRQVNELLYDMVNSKNIHGNFVLLDKEDSILSTNLYYNNQKLFLLNNIIKDIIIRSKDSPEFTHYFTSSHRYDNNQSSSYIFSKGIISNGEVIGTIILQLRSEDFRACLEDSKVDAIILVDNFDNVIYSGNDRFIDATGKYKAPNNNGFVKINRVPYYTTTNILEDIGVKLITLHSVVLVSNLLSFGLFFLLFICVFMIILVVIISEKLVNKKLYPFDQLMEGIKQLKEENFDYRIQQETFDEFVILYQEFNEMSSKVQELIKRNSELSERRRIMEIKNIKSQFNPHFVYNVMESLRYEMVINPKRASEFLVSFANLMRYSINYGAIEVEFKTDIQYIEDYLRIQKARFNRRFDYNIEIDQELLKYKVPKLLIQPIVENSINHSMEYVPKLQLSIKIERDNGGISCTIIDNGKGMSQEKLHELRENLEKEEAVSTSFGLYNVQRTIRLLYGNDYGIYIESDELHGTKTIVNIPFVGGEAIV
ncbi:sensor histidine kinase [Alloiococcus sp. CFN-8]|uniref:sensor histidine kinase n=1 Tax=Alloiococcus sp. CFN-8 TaxID=3416081 RepID=UPI003CF472C3